MPAAARSRPCHDRRSTAIELHLLHRCRAARRRLPGRRARRGVGLDAGPRPRSSARPSGSRLLRYPGATLTTVLLNLRPTHPEFANAGGPDGAARGDRPRRAIIDGAYAMSAATASGPIPPSSPLFDLAADPPVAVRPEGRDAALKKADWTKKADGWHLPGAKKPLDARGHQPDRGGERRACSRRPRRSSRTGRARAQGHPHRAAAGQVRDRSGWPPAIPGGRRGRDDRPRPRPLSAARVEPDA